MNFLAYNYQNLPDELLEHIKSSSTFSDLMRNLGYRILVGLAKLIDGFYDAVNTILSLDLYTLVKTKFPDFFSAIPTVVWALFGLALVIGGLKLSKSRSKDESSKYIDGILTTALLIVAFPFLINAMSDLRTAGVNDVDNLSIGESSGTIGETILSSITIDVDSSKTNLTYLSETNKSPYYIDINYGLNNEGFWNQKLEKNGRTSVSNTEMTILTQYFGLTSSEALAWKETKLGSFFSSKDTSAKLTDDSFERIKNNLGENYYNRAKENCVYINDLFIEFASEIKTWKKTNSDTLVSDNISYDVWYLTTYEDIEDMTFYEKILAYVEALGDPEEFIYAYDFYFLDGMFLMVCTLIALIFAGLKTAKLMYDLIFNQVIAPLVIATDIKNEGRRKYILQNILSTYLVFIIILFIIKLYIVVVIYVITAEFSVAVEIFLILGGMAWVIDGPDSIVKIIGIDAGIKNGHQTLMGAASAAQLAGNVTSSAGSLAKRGVEATASVGARGLSSTINVGKTMANGAKDIGKGISKGAELGKSLGTSEGIGKVAGGIAGSVVGAGKIAGRTALETGKTLKTTAQALAHTASDKNSYDNQAFYDLKSNFKRKNKPTDKKEETKSNEQNLDEQKEADEPK